MYIMSRVGMLLLKTAAQRSSIVLFVCISKAILKMSNSINVHASRTVANSVFEYIRLLGHDLIPSLLFFFYLLCTGSLFLDIIHHMLHHCTKAFHSLLQRLARIHHFHYLYFTRHLKFDRKYVRENRFQALPLELAIQICGSILGYVIASVVMPDGLV